MLIERSAGVSAQNKDDQTPLHLMSLGNWNPYFDSCSHPEVVRMLVEHGVEVSAQDKDGRTPMYLVSQAGVQPEVIPILLVHGTNASLPRTSKYFLEFGLILFSLFLSPQFGLDVFQSALFIAFLNIRMFCLLWLIRYL
jgi:ankyrin repeat protein